MLHARKWLHTKSCPIKTICDYKAHKICLCKYPGFTYGELVYITPWLAVQFGINCMSKVCNFTRQIHWRAANKTFCRWFISCFVYNVIATSIQVPAVLLLTNQMRISFFTQLSRAKSEICI